MQREGPAEVREVHGAQVGERDRCRLHISTDGPATDAMGDDFAAVRAHLLHTIVGTPPEP